MSIPDQERRQRQAVQRISRVEHRIREHEHQGIRRSEEVIRRIDKGDVTPRRLHHD